MPLMEEVRQPDYGIHQVGTIVRASIIGPTTWSRLAVGTGAPGRGHVILARLDAIGQPS